jgi:hypothetical protein
MGVSLYYCPTYVAYFDNPQDAKHFGASTNAVYTFSPRQQVSDVAMAQTRELYKCLGIWLGHNGRQHYIKCFGCNSQYSSNMLYLTLLVTFHISSQTKKILNILVQSTCLTFPQGCIKGTTDKTFLILIHILF